MRTQILFTLTLLLTLSFVSGCGTDENVVIVPDSSGGSNYGEYLQNQGQADSAERKKGRGGSGPPSAGASRMNAGR